MQERSTSSGLMPLPSLPVLPRLGGNMSSSLLPGLPSRPDSSVLLRASRCTCCKHEQLRVATLEGTQDKNARPMNSKSPHRDLALSYAPSQAQAKLFSLQAVPELLWQHAQEHTL